MKGKEGRRNDNTHTDIEPAEKEQEGERKWVTRMVQVAASDNRYIKNEHRESIHA